MVTASILLWNTVYIEKAGLQLKEQGEEIHDESLPDHLFIPYCFFSLSEI